MPDQPELKIPMKVPMNVEHLIVAVMDQLRLILLLVGKKISKSEFGRGFGVKDGIGSGKSRTGHTGLDVPMDPGTPLSIVPPGTVHFTATEGISNGYGNLVVIKLDDGRFIKLNHLSKILVTPGEKVGAGSGKDGGVKVVGLVGYTGYTVPKGPGGSHMHIDVGTGFDKTTFYTLGLQDPAPFVIAGGVVKGGDVKATGEVKQQKSQTSQPQQQLVGTSSPSSSGGGKYKPLLDLISSGESSGGGYSAMYPSENYPQILNMSIAEVVEFQKTKKEKTLLLGAQSLSLPLFERMADNKNKLTGIEVWIYKDGSERTSKYIVED